MANQAGQTLLTDEEVLAKSAKASPLLSDDEVSAKVSGAAKTVEPTPDPDQDLYDDTEVADYLKREHRTKLTNEEKDRFRTDKAADKEGFGDVAEGFGETALSMGSGLYHSIKGGLTGAVHGAAAAAAGMPHPMDEAADVLAEEQKKAYQPETATGKVLTRVLGKVGALPGEVVGRVLGGGVHALEDAADIEAEQYTGEKHKPRTPGQQSKLEIAAETGGEAATNAVMAARGIESAGKVIKAGAKRVGELGKEITGEHTLPKGSTAAVPITVIPFVNSGARATKLLQTALKNLDRGDLEAAIREEDVARSAKRVGENGEVVRDSNGNEVKGVSMISGEQLDPSRYPALNQLMYKAAGQNPKLAALIRNRPKEIMDTMRALLNDLGHDKDVGLHESANMVQEAATEVHQAASNQRTSEVKPLYEAAENKAREVEALQEEVPALEHGMDVQAAKKAALDRKTMQHNTAAEGLRGEANTLAESVNQWAAEDAVRAAAEEERAKAPTHTFEIKPVNPKATAGDVLEGEGGKEHPAPAQGTATAGAPTPEELARQEHEGGVPGQPKQPEPAVQVTMVPDLEHPLHQQVEVSRMEDEGGRVEPPSKVDQAIEMHGKMVQEMEARKQAAQEAANQALLRQDRLDQLRREHMEKLSKLDEAQIPQVRRSVMSMIRNLSQKIKDAGPNSIRAKALTDARNKLFEGDQPTTNIMHLEEVYKDLRNAGQKNPLSTPEENSAAEPYASAASDLNDLIKSISPEIKAARETYENITRDYVEPLRKGPLGKLAGHGADPNLEASLSPVFAELDASKGATPARVREIAQKVSLHNPRAFPSVVSAWVNNTFRKATIPSKDVVTGLHGIGPKVAEVLDTDMLGEQAAVTREMFLQDYLSRGIDARNARMAADGKMELLKMLRDTGNTQGIHALTEGVDLKKMSTAQDIGLGIPHLGRFAASRAVLKGFEQLLEGGNYEELGNIMTDPRGLEYMVALSKTPLVRAAKRQQIVFGWLKAVNQPMAASVIQGQQDKNAIYDENGRIQISGTAENP